MSYKQFFCLLTLVLQTLIVTGGGMLLLGSLWGGDPLNILAVGLAIVLWRTKTGGAGLWAWPLGLGVVFYGKNPSFYQSVPFDIYLLTLIVAESAHAISRGFCRSSGSLAKLPNVGFVLWGVFAFWMATRSLDLASSFVASCQQFGKSECLNELFLAHSGSIFKGLRQGVTWVLGLGLAWMLCRNPSARKHLLFSLAVSSAITLLFGLRHLIVVTSLVPESWSSVCRGYFYCEAFLLTQYPGQVRFISFFGNPGWYGQFLLFILPLFFWFAHVTFKKKNYVLSAAFTAGIFLTYFEALATSQRATWLGVGVITIMAAVLGVKKICGNFSRYHRDKVFVASAASLFVVVIAMIGYVAKPWIFQKWSLNLSERDLVWRLIPEMLKDAPFFGVGTGRFFEAFSKVFNEISAL